MLDRNEAMAKHINARLTLFKNDIADQRLKLAIGGFISTKATSLKMVESPLSGS